MRTSPKFSSRKVWLQVTRFNCGLNPDLSACPVAISVTILILQLVFVLIFQLIPVTVPAALLFHCPGALHFYGTLAEVRSCLTPS